MRIRLAELWAIGLVAVTSHLLAQSYSVKDLGAVAGDSTAAGYGLNKSGQAAGTSSNPSAAIATLFSNGKAISLDNNSSDVSIATAINGNGEVVGRFYDLAVSSLFHAFVSSNGTFTDIHSPSLFPQGTMATGVNSSGEVVGEGELTSSSFHVFLYSNGKMVDLGPPGAFQASPTAINDAGQIIGSYYISSTDEGAFLYENGEFINLGVPVGANGTSAFGINSIGQVAGAIYSSTAPAHAGVWSNGAWIDLGAFSNVATHATGINTAGEVIGTAYFPVKSYHPFIPGKHVGLIFHNGTAVALNKLIPSNSGFVITDGIAINDNGQILCDATNASGVKRAVLLSPK
jgi:probable HAF family extracellular repeat protein